MNQPKRFQRALLATLAASYVGAAGYAAAGPGIKPVEGTDFYEPTFTKADIDAVTAQREQFLNSEIFIGQPGQLNRQVNALTPSRVFQPQKDVNGVQSYIVQLTDEPIATYKGGISGLSATAAPQNRSLVAKGRVSMNTAATQAYQQYLTDRQTHFVQTVNQAGANVEIKQRYTVANNAMLVEMTQEEAILMSQQSGVKRITPNRIFQLQTDRGPEFIGAPALWTGEVSDSGMGVKGEGMVIGIIDTGINTDHIAFAEDEEFISSNPFGENVFVGDCVEDASLCNNKLIGVHSYPEITDVYSASEFQEYPWQQELIRPENGEDYHGHGSHVASTAAGNVILDVPLQTIDGSVTSDGIDLPFTFAQTSGVAPRAHVISYQVCWPGNTGDAYSGCPESALLAAIDDAIADGVDAINFSIGGAEGFPWEDPIELAFLAAREAGISVAAAAGNAGAYYSADHSSPWLTTVGAVSHDRVIDAGKSTIDNFEGNESNWSFPRSPIEGKGFTEEMSGEFVLAEDYADPNPYDDYPAALCNAPFPAGTFTADQIVICERGDIPRVDKAVNAAAGGAGGIVLRNMNWQDATVADNFVIPGINVSMSDGNQLENWIRGNDPGTSMATITASTNDYYFDETLANNLATFSSMGPSNTNNTLVPDIAAPGVSIYAANADDQPFTMYPTPSDWTFMSGTSMASPHVAGALTLLAQQHPDWTPAEIQSAVMMTAGDVLLNTGWELLPTFYNFMAGAGSINVERATQTGLVLDETIENYRNANPDAGGYENWLNLPSMVDMECETTCTWMRVVKATKDGTWTVEGVGQEPGVDIAVTPSEFTLQKGQTQAIMIEASLPGVKEYKVEPNEPGGAWEAVENNYAFFNGQLHLTEVNGNSPDLHMPIVAVNVIEQLPISLDIDASRDQGSETIVVNTDNYSQFTPRYYGLVKPVISEAELTVVGGFLSPEDIEQGWNIQNVTIPEGTKRLVVKVHDFTFEGDNGGFHERYATPNPIIVVGNDLNGNGTFMPSEEEMAEDPWALNDEYFSEVTCMSSSQSELNICNIMNPEPGEYWIATAAASFQYGEIINVTTGYAIIGEDSDAGNITVTGPESHDGNGDYPITVSWDLTDSVEGEMYYGAFDLGNVEGAEGTLGITALNISRTEDAMSWTVSQDQAKAMDVLDVTVKLNANYESEERDYSFNVSIPETMRLATGTVNVSHPDVVDAVEATNNSLHLSGTQTSTRNVGREYVMTTNLTDAMCKTPMIDDYSEGGYIDLFEFGIQPNAEWMVGDSYSYADVPIDWLFYLEGAEFKVYNQENAGYMRMFPVGVSQFNPSYWPMQWHRGPGFLYESLAPFWRGSFSMDYLVHWEDPRGLTIATQYASDRPDLGDLLFLEYDNVTDMYTGDEYDFEMILRSGIDYHPGQFEIIYAYDNLGANLSQGGIFVEGFDSPFAVGAGARDGILSSVLGFDNLDEVLSDDLVVCFDYVGPEQSEIEVSFKVAVGADATGGTHDITFDYSLSGQEDVSLTHSVTVSTNIQVAEIADMTVEENGRIDDILVMYNDANKVPNTVEVSGDNISAEVDGNSFSLIPNTDFHGETEVTVTVRDIEHSGDATSTSFMLTVISDGIEKGCTDSSATNYDASANEDDGSCTYPPEPEPEKDSKSGGSSSVYTLMLLAAALLARRRMTK